MKQLIWAAGVALAVSTSTASAQVPWYKNVQHASGTIVSLDPAPPQEPKSLVVKTTSSEQKFVLSEAADFPSNLKPGDAVTVEYAVDSGGIHWANTVKKGGGKSPPGKTSQ